MKYIEGFHRLQLILYPEKLDDLVSDNNPVRFLDAFVDHLDLALMGFGKTNLEINLAGRPCYSPKSLLKLFIYGYFKKIRTSRKLMEICNTNIEVMWLIERLTPDFRTISDFRKDNAEAIIGVFKEFVKMCTSMGLYNTEIGVQDGSKFRAYNSKDNNVTESKLQKKLEIVEKRIREYLEEMDKNDEEESDPQQYTKEEIEEKIKMLQERKEKYNSIINTMKEEGVTQQSFTDPESRLMKTANGGFDVCYNAQIIVDPVSHMIGAIEVTNNCNDMGLLTPVTTKFKEELGVDVMEVVADKGYEEPKDMLECILNGTIPHVPSKTGKESYEFEVEYKEASINDEMLDSTSSADIRTCLEAGVKPNVYKDMGIEVSIKEEEQYVSGDESTGSCFKLNEAGTAVICPNSASLNKVARMHNKERTRFTSKSACKLCTDKCTTSKFKQIDLKDGQTMLYIKKHQVVKKVIIKLMPNKEKIRNRKTVVEHPFGTIKRWLDGSYVLLKGKKKAAADLALSFLAYNVKRLITMVGVPTIMEKMS